MNYKVFFLFLSVILASCSKLEVAEEVLPDVTTITSSSIVTQLPVINVTADPDDFDKMMASYYNKVSVNGAFSMVNGTGINQMTDQKMVMEIRGRSSVGESYPLKSLGVTFDLPINPFVDSGFAPEKLLPGHSLDFIQTMRLRSSGNDFGVTMIKDLAYSKFAVQNRLDLELMYGLPVQVFVNQKYYGLMNARSESNLLGISSLLDIDPSVVTMVKVKDDSENLKYDEGVRTGADELFLAIENEDAAAIWESVDVDNFIDYIIYQDYIGNGDWGNNVKAFNPGNGKFRFILYDMDLAGNLAVVPLIPKLEFLSADLGKIYRALQKNEGFNSRLENRKQVLYDGFSVSEFNQLVDEMVADIANDIPYLISKYERPKSTLHWKLEIEKLKRDFEGRDRFIRRKYNLN